MPRSSAASSGAACDSAGSGCCSSTARPPSSTTPSTRERPFFGELVDFITGGPIVALALEGEQAIELVRGMMGATDPKKSAPGTIRGDLAIALAENVVHGSDSAASAERELALFFGDSLLP